MKRISRILVAFVLLLALCAAPLEALASTNIGVINASSVNLWEDYKNHNSDADRVCTLKKGTKVSYNSGTKNGYHKVTTSSGKTGWVYDSYIDKSSSGASSSGKTYTVTKTTKAYLNSDGTGRGGYLYKGNAVIKISTKGKYTKVKKVSNGKYVWVLTSRLTKA